MKLKFLLQKNAWFIEHEGSWYGVRDEDQMYIAAAVLPLVVVDEQAMNTQPHLAGVARLADELSSAGSHRLFRKVRDTANDAVRVTLVEPDGTPVVERLVPLDTSALGSIEWSTRPFRDGWLQASTSVSLDNVRKLELRAFLPNSPNAPDSAGKALTVHNQTDGTVSEVWLKRAKSTIVPLVSKGGRGKVVLRLECEPEVVEESGDSRQLGFLLLGESLEAA